MSSPRPTPPARSLLLALLPLAFLALAPAAGAQTFALGAGGGLLNDTKALESVDDFSETAGFAYLEMSLEPGLLLQARYTRTTLPPSETAASETDLDAATLSVAYLLNEGWWKAGFVGGVGAYFLRGETVGLGTVPVETSESVFGLNLGVLTVFEVSRRWDVRLEAIGHLIRDEAKRKPIVVSASVSYRF